MKAYELLKTEQQFTKINFAVGTDGYFTNPAVNPDSGECRAVKWDMQGALYHCYPFEKAEEIKEMAWAEISKLNKNVDPTKDRVFLNLSDFNDRAGYFKVIELLKKIEK